MQFQGEVIEMAHLQRALCSCLPVISYKGERNLSGRLKWSERGKTSPQGRCSQESSVAGSGHFLVCLGSSVGWLRACMCILVLQIEREGEGGTRAHNCSKLQFVTCTALSLVPALCGLFSNRGGPRPCAICARNCLGLSGQLPSGQISIRVVLT